MKRYLCVHSHFYQPPRENPWLEAVENQDSAAPFHDWNERISFESYRTNGQARVLDGDGWIVDVTNNYSKISFNFGPTLLSWMEKFDPLTYSKILEGDQQSRERFGGHGSALAQAYSHIIMPLANRRDKETQVRWGLADFRKRFQRDPEGMWLPETAVDLETLEILQEHGMKFVILAPRQAKSFRALNSDGKWTEIKDELFDTKIPYLVNLPSGKSIVAFFYNGDLSKSVAFERLLNNGNTFADRLVGAFEPDGKNPQLVHIATDGETYGHHHRHGEMALAYALKHLEETGAVTLTNYGQYLEMQPPLMEARIHENSSWSCVHGIERWRSDCGCNSGMKGGWTQAWRGPLREALDFIRDELNPLCERAAREMVHDLWQARDAYIDVILDRSEKSREEFFRRQGMRELGEAEKSRFLKLMEIQRHLILMYTSCGWFFDEVSGVETVQNIQYAYRALDLAQEVLQTDLVPIFKEKLAQVPSNLPELRNGREIFDRYVAPARVDFMNLGAHFAVNSVFTRNGEHNEIYCYDVNLKDRKTLRSGRASLVFGHGDIVSRITGDHWAMIFGVLHFGDHNINAGVSVFLSEEKYREFSVEIASEFSRADFPNVLRVLDKWFGTEHYSLRNLFRDEQKKVVDNLLRDSTDRIQRRFRDIYDQDYPLLCSLADVHLPVPQVYLHISEFLQNRSVLDAIPLKPGPVDLAGVQKFLQEAGSWKVPLDQPSISRHLELAFESRLARMSGGPEMDSGLEELRDLVQVIQLLPFEPDFPSIQSQYFQWHEAILRDGHWQPDSHERNILRQIGDGLKIRWHS